MDFMRLREKIKKIAVLTSGGDSPGMNACVVAIARNASLHGIELVGVQRGYNGLIGKAKKEDSISTLPLNQALDIADLPGTYLRTARCEEFFHEEYQKKAADFLKSEGIEGLIVIGGDGSFHGAQCLSKLGIPCIGIPGTIDNDLAYTETTLGYDTAVNVCVDAVRAIRATSRSHDRPHVVEVMGRKCGNIALKTAVATGAEILLVPEVEWDIMQVANRLNALIKNGNTRATVVVAEGCWASMQPFDVYAYLSAHKEKCYVGEGINASRLASVLKCMCGAEVRATVVGYTQRGAHPTASDSTFAFDAGTMAVEMFMNNQVNRIIGVENGVAKSYPIDDAFRAPADGPRNMIDDRLYKLVNRLM